MQLRYLKALLIVDALLADTRLKETVIIEGAISYSYDQPVIFKPPAYPISIDFSKWVGMKMRMHNVQKNWRESQIYGFL